MSSILNVAYLMPLVAKGFFLSENNHLNNKYSESTLFIWLPPVLTGLGCIILFFIAGHIVEFLKPIVLVE